VYKPFADVLVRVTLSPDYPRWARAAALTFQMIFQRPVRHVYRLIAPPTRLIVGAEDHVVPLGSVRQARRRRPARRLHRPLRATGGLEQLTVEAAADTLPEH
jgi:hypothetical protein